LFNLLAAPERIFQTAWFMESLATQILVIHIIRTRHLPFIQSRASKYLLISTLTCVAFGWLMPYTALGEFFKFQALPGYLVAILITIVICYLAVVEGVKRIFYRRYFNLM